MVRAITCKVNFFCIGVFEMALKITEIGDELLAAASERMTGRISDHIEKTLSLIARGKGFLSETKSRRELFEQRENALDGGLNVVKKPAVVTADTGLEQLIGPTNEILSIEFFEAGLLAAKAVGRIRLAGGAKFGTGFFVAPGILITNNHVLPTVEVARISEFELNAEANRFGPPQSERILNLDPGKFFLTDVDHDFTLVAVADDGVPPPVESFGWHPLIKTQGKVRVGDAVNIIQHPDGDEKAVVVHKSNFLHLENGTSVDRFCWYSGDTMSGSSGSPVFNKNWEVVALHHKGVPKTNIRGEILDRDGRPMSEERFKQNPDDAAWLANEGIRISRVVAAVGDARTDDAEHETLRIELLERWQSAGEQRRAQNAAANGGA